MQKETTPKNPESLQPVKKTSPTRPNKLAITSKLAIVHDSKALENLEREIMLIYQIIKHLCIYPIIINE